MNNVWLNEEEENEHLVIHDLGSLIEETMGGSGNDYDNCVAVNTYYEATDPPTSS